MSAIPPVSHHARNKDIALEFEAEFVGQHR
jgi:hypothetical protein